MPATIPASPSYIDVRIKMTDTFGEVVTKQFTLAGDTDDTVLKEILDDIEATSNATMEVSISSTRVPTGLRSTALDAIERTVGTVLVLGFEKPHPLNALKEVNRSFSIPTPKDSVIDAQGNPDPVEPAGAPANTRENLGRLVANLETQLTYLAIDGDWYPGSFTYDPTESGLATTPRIYDGA